MERLRNALLDEGVITLDGLRWSDGFAWCELRPTYMVGENSCNIRYLWSSECRRGYGTSLLTKVIRVADGLGKSLYLEAEPFRKRENGKGLCFDGLRPGGMTRDQLTRWYRSHGFEHLEGNVMLRKGPSERPQPSN